MDQSPPRFARQAAGHPDSALRPSRRPRSVRPTMRRRCAPECAWRLGP